MKDIPKIRVRQNLALICPKLIKHRRNHNLCSGHLTNGTAIILIQDSHLVNTSETERSMIAFGNTE